MSQGNFLVVPGSNCNLSCQDMVGSRFRLVSKSIKTNPDNSICNSISLYYTIYYQLNICVHWVPLYEDNENQVRILNGRATVSRYASPAPLGRTRSGKGGRYKPVSQETCPMYCIINLRAERGIGAHADYVASTFS